jgi:hypothetical protein
MLPNDTAPADIGLPKTDYSYVVDPTTELSSTELTRAFLDVAAASLTQPRAWVRCTISGTTITVVDHSAVWGATESVKPTAARSATGVYTITWPATVTDLNPTVADRVTYTVSLRACASSLYDSTYPAVSTAYVSAANVATVKVFRVTAAAYDPEQFTLVVW